jgi:hypothetical protein
VVAGFKPVTELVKLPAPVPSAVFVSPVVGLPVVFQHTPRAVMGAPPSEVIFPPEEAVVGFVVELLKVVNTGKVADVVTDCSFP